MSLYNGQDTTPLLRRGRRTGDAVEATIAMLTGLLVLITGFCAWQTKRTVDQMQSQTTQTVAEMRRARGAQLLPKLVPTLYHRAAGLAFLRIVNVGPGPAINVDVSLWLEPNGGRRRWKSPVVAPGETHDFIPRVPGIAGVARLDQLTAYYVTLHVAGTRIDALGDTHGVAEQVDIRETWELVKAPEELAPQDLMREIATELKKVREEVAKIRRSLGK